MVKTVSTGSRLWLVVASTIVAGAVACAPDGGAGDDGTGYDDTAQPAGALTGQPVSRRTRLAAILVRWSGGPTDATTPATARAALFNDATSVRNFMLESSYGQHDISGDAFGPFTIAAPNGCDFVGLKISAENAAAAAGVNLASFTNEAIYFARFTPCTFASLAEQGTPANPKRVSWFNGTLTSVTHELGHNFGLFDAQGWRCPGAPIAAPASCSVVNFGDPFDPMGAGFKRHHNAYEKTAESFFGRCNVVTLPRSRTVDIFPIETASNSVQALRIPMSPSLCPTGITSCQYVVEYRQPIGFDAPATAPNGVYIHVGSVGAAVRSSFLLDMTPATTSLRDSALPVGSTFTDPNGVAIKVNANTSNRATVQVTIPGGTGNATCLDGSVF